MPLWKHRIYHIQKPCCCMNIINHIHRFFLCITTSYILNRRRSNFRLEFLSIDNDDLHFYKDVTYKCFVPTRIIIRCKAKDLEMKNYFRQHKNWIFFCIVHFTLNIHTMWNYLNDHCYVCMCAQ